MLTKESFVLINISIAPTYAPVIYGKLEQATQLSEITPEKTLKFSYVAMYNFQRKYDLKNLLVF